VVTLFPGACAVAAVNPVLEVRHYLGGARRGFGWADEWGVMVFSNPTSRRLPQRRWLELTRWCLDGHKNGGSRQWAAVSRWLRNARPEVTTVISYSDPGAGHTGALYRACNWRWAPTWHRLVPPPSGNGTRSGKAQGVKDRWVYPLAPDESRAALLGVPESYARRFPCARYEEPRFRRDRPVGGGANYKAWKHAQQEETR